jgi:hypothetical protein
MDVEGTDSTTNWEDDRSSKYISLFGLTICNTIIVNIWLSDVGRFNGSQYSILKTAFELNIRLWKVE